MVPNSLSHPRILSSSPQSIYVNISPSQCLTVSMSQRKETLQSLSRYKDSLANRGYSDSIIKIAETKLKVDPICLILIEIVM